MQSWFAVAIVLCRGGGTKYTNVLAWFRTLFSQILRRINDGSARQMLASSHHLVPHDGLKENHARTLAAVHGRGMVGGNPPRSVTRSLIQTLVGEVEFSRLQSGITVEEK